MYKTVTLGGLEAEKRQNTKWLKFCWTPCIRLLIVGDFEGTCAIYGIISKLPLFLSLYAVSDVTLLLAMYLSELPLFLAL